MTAHFPKKMLFVVHFLSFFSFLHAQDGSNDWQENNLDGCTDITAGRLATAGGSVITSHTTENR